MNFVDTFLFSRNEARLLQELDDSGKRPRDLMRASRIPHASLYLAFGRLVSRGLAKRFIKERKIYWQKINSFENPVPPASGIHVHTESSSIKRSVNEILKLQSGDKILIFEGTQTDSGWFDLFTKEETLALNKKLANKKIICESILPESYFKDAIPYLGTVWAASYRTRPIITYVVEKNRIFSNAVLIILKSKALLLYAKQPLAIEIKNKEIFSLLRDMVEAIKETAQKVAIRDDFSFRAF